MDKPNSLEPKEASTQIEAEDSESTFKILDCRCGGRIERSLPLSLAVKDSGNVIKPLKLSARELEELDIKHEWHNTFDVGDLGEKLTRCILTKLYGWRESSPKLYNFVKTYWRDKQLDLLMEDGDSNYYLIEVKTTLHGRKFGDWWKETVSLLEEREKSLLSEIRALKGRVRKLIVDVDFRSVKARRYQPPSKLSNKGVNLIQIRPLSSYQYSTRYRQALEYKMRGMPEEKIAEKFNVKKKTIQKYISKAKNPERYKEYGRNYNRTHKKSPK